MSDLFEIRYERDPNVVYREIAGEKILVPIRKRTADMAAIFVLNETGARVWDLMDGERSLGTIRDLFVQEYCIDAESAAKDICEIAAHLQEMNLIRVAGDAV